MNNSKKISGTNNPNYKHGGLVFHKKEFNSWRAMSERCNVKNNKRFPDYAGRGIKVCDRWQGKDGFVNFLEDMGKKPTPKHSIDRKDNDGNYNPENCRWATPTEQARNKRMYRSNKSGYTGINWEKRDNRWKVRVYVNGKRKYIGLFKTIDKAIQARDGVLYEL